MLVKYKIIEIENKGKGMVADEFIPKDTLLWRISDNSHICFENE
jgi:hypothetical protein